MNSKQYDLYLTYDESVQKEFNDLHAKLKHFYGLLVYDGNDSFESVINDCVCLLVFVNKHLRDSKKSINDIVTAQKSKIPFFVVMLESVTCNEFEQIFANYPNSKFEFFNQSDKMSNLWSGQMFNSLIDSINEHFHGRILRNAQTIEPEIQDEIVFILK